MEFFKGYLRKVAKKIAVVDTDFLEKTAALIVDIKRKNKKVILAGNGGSAAIASHISVDLTKNAGVRAINFNEADLITCFANDYRYEKWLEKALDFYADKGDLVILISSSGKSKNIVNAALKAKKLELTVVALSGFNKDNPLRRLADVNFWVDSMAYNVVESVHGICLSAIIDKIASDKNT